MLDDFFNQPIPPVYLAIQRAYRHLSASEVNVLFALVGMAHHHGGNAVPISTYGLSVITGLSYPPIISSLRTLVEAGIVTKVEERYGSKAASYTVNVAALEAFATSKEPPQSSVLPVRKRTRQN